MIRAARQRKFIQVRCAALELWRRTWAQSAREEWITMRAAPRGSAMRELYYSTYREARARAQVYRQILRGELG